MLALHAPITASAGLAPSPPQSCLQRLAHVSHVCLDRRQWRPPACRHSGQSSSIRRSWKAHRLELTAAMGSSSLSTSTGGGLVDGPCPPSFWGSELQTLVLSVPYRKLLLWMFVFAFAYQMHEFFGVAMGTFIVAFVGNSFVTSTQNAQPVQLIAPDVDARRRLLVVIYFLMILAFVTLFGVLTIPDIAREGADFVSRLKSDNVWVVLVQKMRDGLGDTIMESLERFVLLATTNDITRAAATVSEHADWTPERSVQLGLAVSSMVKGYTSTAASIITAMLKSVTKFAIQIGMALILGFFMLWDLPTISRGVTSLTRSRLAPFYHEVAPVLSVFGKLFGKALEAQARIAVVNTALTAAGMWLLAIPGIGLLSLFVFVCSFIPIAGVIISTTPIGFVALTEYGFMKLALVILMVTGVHFVEAYMLNPAIYSAHLKLHPLLVLSTLVVAEHSMGVWGLLLAVPMTVFALDYLIQYPDSSVTEVGEKELEKVMRTEDAEEADEDYAISAAAAIGSTAMMKPQPRGGGDSSPGHSHAGMPPQPA